MSIFNSLLSSSSLSHSSTSLKRQSLCSLSLNLEKYKKENFERGRNRNQDRFLSALRKSKPHFASTSHYACFTSDKSNPYTLPNNNKKRENYYDRRDYYHNTSNFNTNSKHQYSHSSKSDTGQQENIFHGLLYSSILFLIPILLKEWRENTKKNLSYA